MTEQMEVWYLASTKGGSHAFTMDSRQAMTDLAGHPIVATGSLRKILDRRREQFNLTIESLWEHLLDTMEEMYIAKEEDPEGVKYTKLRSKVQAIVESLAIMEYGYLWENDKAKAIEKIVQTAKVKYEQSSE